MLTDSKMRIKALYAFVGVIVFIFIIRLVGLQLVNGKEYRETSEKSLLRSVPIKAPRGEILDRYGTPLVVNDMGFAVQFHKIDMDKATLNKTIMKIVYLMETEGETYDDTFPVTKDKPYAFDFDDEDDERSWKEKRKIDTTATPADVISYFKDRYDITGDYSEDEIRKIIGVRYEMEVRLFSITTPFTFASNVNINTVTKIKEQQSEFPGVDIAVEPIRKKTNGNLAVHILGRVGKIYKEEYEKLKGKNYGMNDIIGKDGMEEYLEPYLKGTDGMSSIEQNLEGKVIRTVTNREPVSGNYAVLTIDSKLQKVAEDSLEKALANVRANSKGDWKAGASAYSGAVVVLDVNNGEVLAMASYPDYNSDTISEDYQKLLKNPYKPMFNRAISGAYTPGSTYKIATALAALEEGVTSRSEIINCDGVYRFYAPSYTPRCWALTDLGHGHGNLDVAGAIKNSCNIFFYEMGRRLTIDNLNKYARKLGLGELTGIELSGESKGILASPENKKKNNMVWYPGDNIQAAIGQSDNMFTPLQLANYIATVVNGGKRYKVHLVKKVQSYTKEVPELEPKPEVIADIDISQENYKVLMEGMRSVTEDGTASNVFADFPISVGGKTGSAQVPNSAATGLFVAFAPYDNPQIAIAVVGEKAAHGNSMAPVARDIITQYFMPEASGGSDTVNVNTLIR